MILEKRSIPNIVKEIIDENLIEIENIIKKNINKSLILNIDKNTIVNNKMFI